jgi:hypothetical protein
MLYYDLWDDPAGLGSERDSLTVGDVFFYDYEYWIIVEIDTVNSRLVIEKEKMMYDD